MKILAWIRLLWPKSTKPVKVETMYNYFDLMLSTYIEIVVTGNTGLLVYKGNPSEQEIQERWEQIVEQNAQANGSQHNHLIDNIRDYIRYLATYISVQSALLQLHLGVDDECIAFLESKGFRIDTSSNAAFIDSIRLALQKVKNVITKLKSRHKLIIDSMGQSGDDSVPITNSADAMIANLSAALGFAVEPWITLSRYNEFAKIVKRRVEIANELKNKKP